MLDYIRIVGISDVSFVSSDAFSVTLDIVYSHDPDFKNPKLGVFILRLSDFVEMPNASYGDIEVVASRLMGQVLMRGKDEDRAVKITHLLGMDLSDWLVRNVIRDLKNPVPYI